LGEATSTDFGTPFSDSASSKSTDLDFLLEAPTVENLKKVLDKENYLLSRDDLFSKLKDVMENLDFRFRNMQES
jgi:hypothetical protein